MANPVSKRKATVPHRMTSKQTYDDLIDKHQKFVDAYLETADRVEAYLAAGYSPSKKTLRNAATNLYHKLAPIIKDEMDKRIGTGAVMALRVIRELMEHASSETVRLQAAKDYLTRAGFDKPVQTELTVNDSRDKTNAELQAEIQELLAKVTSDPGPKSASG